MTTEKANEEPTLELEGGEIEEHTEDSDFASSFNEIDDDGDEKETAAGNEPDKSEKPKASEPERDEQGRFKPKDGDQPKDGKGEKPDKSEKDETSDEDKGEATTELERLAKEAEKDDPPAKAEPKPKQQEPPPRREVSEPKPTEKTVIDDKFLDTVIDSVENEDQRDKLKETLNDEFPELKPLMLAMAKAISGASSQSAPAEPASQAKPETQQQEPASELDYETARMRLLYECERRHEGSIRTVESNDFMKWLDNQSAGVQKLADSGDPDVSVTVIKAYQEAKARDAAKEHDEKKTGNRDKKNALHSTTAKPNQGSRSDHSDAKDDFSAGFNAPDKEI